MEDSHTPMRISVRNINPKVVNDRSETKSSREGYNLEGKDDWSSVNTLPNSLVKVTEDHSGLNKCLRNSGNISFDAILEAAKVAKEKAKGNSQVLLVILQATSKLLLEMDRGYHSGRHFRTDLNWGNFGLSPTIDETASIQIDALLLILDEVQVSNQEPGLFLWNPNDDAGYIVREFYNQICHHLDPMNFQVGTDKAFGLIWEI
ncbi:unnamed protein product [Vicia faba]|uniref:Uncharacterized protein n=1 Tax=Vicia faba TaxID=3906 RepID=A0AAV0ZG45_VICFA|nr:unnamed protein product [Vicia faba]